MKRIIPYIPFIIITGLMVYSIYQVQTSNKAFTYPHYIGFVLTLIGLVSLIYSVRINKLATFFALLLGTFSQAAFTTTIYRFRIGFTINDGIGLDILIQPSCLFLLVLFVILNRNFLRESKDHLIRLIKTKPGNEAEQDVLTNE